jgi:tRNA dimethylallyltransferase
MAAKRIDLPIVVIVGPTASGKTGLAIEIAKQYSGEIICADSRTVYKGMDIGTAKPTIVEMHGVPHWGLDLVSPNEYFSAADFKKYANEKIIEIKERGHVPILVGGTGLYIDAVLFDYQFGSPVNRIIRLELQRMSVEELQHYCYSHQVNLPENDKNKRYLIRAIDNKNQTISRKKEPIYKNIIVGITTDKNVLQERISSRIEQLLKNGVVSEAIMLGKKYGWQIESMKSNIYPFIHSYVQNEMTMDELISRVVIADWHLAKRQITWFKRNKFIHWDSLDHANTYVSTRLAQLK